VNHWWICDAGRYGHAWIDHARVEEPAHRESGVMRPVGWDAILNEVAAKLRGAKRDGFAVFLSPMLSNEALYLAKKLFSASLGFRHVYLVSPHAEGNQDDFLIRADKHPNRKGAEILGFAESKADMEQVLELAESGGLDGLYLFGQDLGMLLKSERVERALRRVPCVVFQGTNKNGTVELAHYVLASTVFAETSGTFTNFEGKVQRFEKALEPYGASKPDTEILGALSERLGFPLPFTDSDDMLAQMQREYPPFGRVVARVAAVEETVLKTT
jgi:NADH-quinone oxidoreductase subunit G